jgi:hypothetical protein
VTSVGIGSFRIDEDEVSQILVWGHGGNDTIRIQGLDGDTTAVVNAGAGDDTINVGDGDLNTNVLSAVTVNGDAGDDLLIIRDGDDDGGTYNITPESLQKTNSQLVSWTVGDTESLQVVGTEFTDTFNLSGNVSVGADIDIELQGNGGQDTFNINEVDDRADVTLLGGNDTDTFNIGNGDYDTNIDGNVTVDGDASGDILTVNDRDDVGSMDVYTINASTFEKDGSDGVLTFSDVSTFNVDGSGDGTEFKILGTASGTTVNVDGRAGDDEFNVSDYDYDSNIFGTLTINGGGGAPVTSWKSVTAPTRAATITSSTSAPPSARISTRAPARSRSSTTRSNRSRCRPTTTTTTSTSATPSSEPRSRSTAWAETITSTSAPPTRPWTATSTRSTTRWSSGPAPAPTRSPTTTPPTPRASSPTAIASRIRRS